MFNLKVVIVCLVSCGLIIIELISLCTIFILIVMSDSENFLNNQKTSAFKKVEKQPEVNNDFDFQAPLNNCVITQDYGYNPISNTWHDSVDMVGESKTEIFAISSGQFVYKGVDLYGANSVIIKHQPKLYSIYAHLSTFANINENQYINSGTVIGYQGNTGLSTGEHLHFELSKTPYPGDHNSYDPRKYIELCSDL